MLRASFDVSRYRAHASRALALLQFMLRAIALALLQFMLRAIALALRRVNPNRPRPINLARGDCGI